MPLNTIRASFNNLAHEQIAFSYCFYIKTYEFPQQNPTHYSFQGNRKIENIQRAVIMRFVIKRLCDIF